MKIEINFDNYPKQKKEIVDSLRKKFQKRHPGEKFYPSKVEFSYEYCVRMGNNVDKSDIHKYMKETFGGSFKGKYKRFVAFSDSEEFPQELIDSVKKNWEKENEEEKIKNKKKLFITEILESVGKEPHFNEHKMPAVMNGKTFIKELMKKGMQKPTVYPTLEDLKAGRKDIYDEYLEMTKDMKLVFFMPEHEKADEYGFLVYNVVGAYRKANKADHTIIVTTENIHTFQLFDNEQDTAYWKFNQDHAITTEKSRSIKPDSEFLGSNRGKYYKLSTSDVETIINKIFKHGVDINRNPQRGVTNHGDGLFQLNF